MVTMVTYSAGNMKSYQKQLESLSLLHYFVFWEISATQSL